MPPKGKEVKLPTRRSTRGKAQKDGQDVLPPTMPIPTKKTTASPHRTDSQDPVGKKQGFKKTPSEVVPASTSAAPKRGPGRPPKKPKDTASTQEPNGNKKGSAAKKTQPTRRGCPRKILAPSAEESELDEEQTEDVKYAEQETKLSLEDPELTHLEVPPKQPHQGQQLVPGRKRRGRPPRKDKLDQAEQEPPKKRGRPFKQEASQALVVSPNGAAPKKKQSTEKSISQCSPLEFRNSILDAKKMNDIEDPNELKLIQDRIKKVAEDIDWQCVLEILPVRPKKQLSLFLIGCFHEEHDRFIINGVPIDMKPLVHPVVGLSRSGNKVDLSRSGELAKELKRDKEYGHMYDVFTLGGRSMSANEGLRYLTKDEDEVVFTICFVLEAMAFIFGPKTNRCLDREYLQWFRNLDHLKNLNWCDFTADLLCREIKKFNASPARFKKCGGCLLLPTDVFYDLVTPKDERPNGFPRANYITKAHLKTLVDFKELEKRVTFEAVEDLYEFYNLGKPNDPIFKEYKDHAHQQHSSEQA